MRVDFLIVGQGLAGSLLGWELLQGGAGVLVVDNGESNASRVAAGLINPISGMRLVKTPGVDALLPEAVALYRHLERQFGRRFYVDMPLLRVLANARERQYAEQRCVDAAYADYIGGLHPETAAALFGSLLQKHSGYLLTAPLLDNLRECLCACGSYRRAALGYDEIAQSSDGVCWQDVAARRVVFCEGYRVRENPWFRWLPLQPVKGEILTLRAGPLPEQIVNYGQWLIPLAAQTCRCGATFDRDSLDTESTEQGKQELLANLHKQLPQIEIRALLDHRAGIRPATLDKHPFLGAHPHQQQITIFNGFGAKGSLAIPYYARRFADFLLNGAALPANANIERYAAAYFPR